MAAPLQLVGQTLSHYRIIEQVGAGGMGIVYRARDEQLERDVAVKVLPIGTLADESARKRFRKEALALAKLNHPSIATIFEFSTQNDTDYLVTEYISGLTLDNKLAAGALSEKEVMGLGIQLAQGLGAAHEQGIVHRDLKPANLRLTSDGRLKILDFGLAQLMPHASEVGMTATLTESQKVTGTLPYMAPEQLRGEPAEPRTDIWAAGAVLYEIATAHRPFEQKIPSALTDDIIHTAPRPPRSLRPALSPKLEAVILKCLEKDPAHRYQSAQELQTDLERLSTGVTPIAARRRVWPMLGVAAVLLALLAAGGVFYLRLSPKLTEKDTIVLADFENKTGDAVFDDTLKQGLSVSLSQSPFLNLLPDDKVNAVLKLMGRAPGDRLTREVAREVCVRSNSRAMLAGSISSLGSQYVIGLKAVSCSSGDALAQEQVQATAKEEVLKALDKAATSLRGKLGESLASVQKYDLPLEEATTPSLEALKAYSVGGIASLKRAIELDPNFAMAYASLGGTYFSLGENGLAAENLTKAYELRQRSSEREKYFISATYYSWATGELEKANQVCEEWGRAYPREADPHSLFMGNSMQLGHYDRVLVEELESIRLDPDHYPTGDLVGAYAVLNRFDEAKATYEQARARNVDDRGLHGFRYYVAFAEHDSAEMQRQLNWAKGKSGAEDQLLSMHSDTQAYEGHLQKARELSLQAADTAMRSDQKETAALYVLNAALREAEVGNASESRQQATSALVLAASRDYQILAAVTMARAGDTKRAQTIADDLHKRYPLNTLLNDYWLPTIRAVVELKHKRPDQALESLQEASAYELGVPWVAAPVAIALYPPYVRGEAYLEEGQGRQAASEFQKLIDHPGVVLNFVLGALAHLQLGRAYAMSGDAAKAKGAYQDFFALWKDADPDIPILKEAKAEYAKLQ
jgi:serine/threonine protein kinase/tetratricopeptide (TPR) repeat protein